MIPNEPDWRSTTTKKVTKNERGFEINCNMTPSKHVQWIGYYGCKINPNMIREFTREGKDEVVKKWKSVLVDETQVRKYQVPIRWC